MLKSNNMNNLNTVAEALGYSDSKNYFQYEDIICDENFDFHWNKVLSIIKPDALYTIDGSPFILFFSEKNVEFCLIKY